MAVLGRVLFSSSERVDLPDLLSLDSYVAGDFKYLIKSLVGDTKPFILKGFDIIDPQNAIGTQGCSIRVADSAVYYPGSSTGSFYYGLEEGNVNAQPLVPELRKNATNFIYATFSTFNSSVDSRAFWDPDKDGGDGGEFTQDVNTESVLKVEINVSTGSFPANTIPIAKVEVGPVTITAITDCRDLMFRLGTGGISPDPFATYQFRSLPNSGYQRTEPPITMTAGGANPFQGGDKNIYTLKEWMDLVMTKFKEISGTTYWYEDLSTFNIITGFIDALATTFKSKGQWQHSSATPGMLTWTDDLIIKVTQDLRTTIVRAGDVTLADEQVAYLNLQRNLPINSSDNAVAWTNGQPYINTVGGAVGYFENLSKGDYIKKVNDQNYVYLRVEEFYDSVNLGGSVTTASGARSVRLSSNYLGATGVEKARYDKGVYQAADVIVSDRNQAPLSAAGGNFHWLAIRSDTIENIAQIQSFTLTGTLDQADGSTARVVSTAHGMSDGDLITVTAPAAQAGTYLIEVEDANTFYIQTANTTTGAFTAFYGLMTTAARTNGYGLQLESAEHGMQSGDTAIVAGTTNFNGSYVVARRNDTTLQFAFPSVQAQETAGTATLARINVRLEQGLDKIIQGEIIDIGDGASANVRSFIGMQSASDTHPFYSISPSYNTLDGMANYNSLPADSLTARVSKLTAMMADKAQDKTIRYIPSPTLTTITNTTNGAAQEITFNPSGSTLTIVTPGSTGNATITLPATAPGISLLQNQTAYVQINRNTPSTPSIVVANTADMIIDENTFIVAMRLDTTAVYLWEGSIIIAGSSPFIPEAVVRQNQTLKLVEGGTWSWNQGTSTLTWSANAFIQILGLANSVNQINAGSVVLTAGQVAYVDINRVGPAGVLTVNVGTNSTTTLTTDRFVIARRENTDVIVGAHSMRLVNGESKLLYAGTSNQTLNFIGSGGAGISVPTYSGPGRTLVQSQPLTDAISSIDTELNKWFGQLQLLVDTGNPKRATVSNVNKNMLNTTVLGQEMTNLVLKFDGAVINFETGVITEADGTTPLGDNFTPAAIPTGDWLWYSVSLTPNITTATNEITAKLTVLPAASSNAVKANAPKAVFGGVKKIAQIQIQKAASGINNLSNGNIVQLGVGSGSGGGSGGITAINMADVTRTTLPTGTGLVVDGITVNAGDLVLFANLGSGNNMVYKASGTGTTITGWVAQYVFQGGTSSSPGNGDTVYVKTGDIYTENFLFFNATEWKNILNNKVSNTLLDNVIDQPLMYLLAADVENFVMEYSISRGTARSIGTFYVCHNGTNVNYEHISTRYSDTGVTLTATIIATYLVIQYTTTSTGSNATLKRTIRTW